MRKCKRSIPAFADTHTKSSSIRNMRMGLLASICAVACFLPLAAQDRGEGGDLVLDPWRMETQPGGYFYPNFIENLSPDAVWLSEESNGFGLPDQPKVYYEGDSWTQFRWHYAGYGLNSGLDDGAPALRLPFLGLGAMVLRGESPRHREYGLFFLPRPAPASGRSAARFMASTALAKLGGWTALGKLAVANHATLRADDLYATRRRLGGNFQLDFGLEQGGERSSLLLAGGYSAMERRFNDFNRRDGQFVEDASLGSLLGRWQRRFAAGEFAADLVFNAGKRGNLLAEYGRYPQETRAQEQASWLAGAAWTGRSFQARFSWLRERQEMLPVAPDAGKALRDVDGQALLPFERLGVFRADTFALTLERRLGFSWLGRRVEVEPFLDLAAVLRSGRETPGRHNAVHFAGDPALVFLWQGPSAYRNDRRSARAGGLLRMGLGGRFDLEGRLFLHYQGLSFQDGGALAFLQPGGEAGVGFQAGPRTRIDFRFGALPYDLGSQVSDFLEKSRPGAAVREWRDADGDGLFRAGEEGALLGWSGGAAHTAAAGLKPSLRQRLQLSLSAPLSRRFQLDLKGLLKRVVRPLWVRFAGEYGRYENIAGREVYLLDRPVTGFELGNAPFAKDPFYAQFLVRVHGESERRWYFSFSFLAHMGMGHAAFGNGPENNDIGVLAESQAFPNTWINGFGRLDGDRAFVGRVFLGSFLAKRLFLGGSVKYRDGNPFAFLEAFRRDGQWLITYQTIQGEDERSRKGGPREDCIWDFNAKLSYELRLFGRPARLELSGFNLLDFGGELSENAFSNDLERMANELQLPRSLRLGVTLEL